LHTLCILMMNDILKDFSPAALVAAIQDNTAEWYAALSRSPQVVRYDTPHVNGFISGVACGWLNPILRTRLTAETVDEGIESTLAHFRSRNVHELSWFIEPEAQPADLGERLLAHGLKAAPPLTGMAADLLALSEDMVMPSELKIVRVGESSTLHDFVRVSLAGFEIPKTSENAFFKLLDGLGYPLPLRNYVGYFKGKPVGTAQLFLGAGVAGMYWLCILPGARRQGIGRRMLLAALQEARALGYRIGVLNASQMGEGIYRRLGFQEYCRSGYYDLSETRI
jgi:GNAT superfamily N-acetyltransferase